MRFNVYLNITGNSGAAYLDYEKLIVGVKLTAINPALANNPTNDPNRPRGLSQVDVEATRECNAAYDYAAYSIVEADGVQLHLDPAFTSPLPCLPISGNKILLFVVVVDAKPGETLTLSCVSFDYARIEKATEELITCSDSGNAAVLGDPITVTVPSPTLTGNIVIGCGTVDKTNTPAYQDIPFEVTVPGSGDLAFKEMEVNLIMTTTKAFGKPELIATNLSGIVYTDDVFSFTNASTGLTDYFIKVVFSEGKFEAGTSIPFVVRIFGPQLISVGGKVCPSIQASRILLQDETCATPTLAEDADQFECADFDGSDPCTDNITITVVGEPVGGPPSECQLRAKIYFDWTGTNDEIELTGLKLGFSFSGNNGVSITSVPISTALQCPSYNNNTTECSACVTVDGLDLNYCFQKGPGPDNLILRRKVSGVPVFLTVIFNAGDGCLDGVTLTRAEITAVGAATCVPATGVVATGFPVCPEFINGKIETEGGKPVTSVKVTAQETNNLCTEQYSMTSDPGLYAICVCNFGTFDVTPERNDNYLNGVSTLDLALITKHILGVEPFTSPYQIIAANANNNSTITTIDVVELRKLILGIYEVLPANTSWRFVPKNHVFPNPSNPIGSSFPEKITASVSPGQSAIDQDFIGIKVGDVNASVDPRQASGSAWLAANAVSSEKGDYITVPLRVQSRTPLTALQAAFRFDPEALELMGPSLGDVRGLSPDCFGFTKTAEGLIRFVWLAPDPETDFLRPGQTICHLTFKTKRPLRPGEKALRLEAGDLAPEGYTLDDRRFDLKLAAAQATEARSEAFTPVSTGVRAFAAPNPSTGETRLNVESELGGKARVFVFSAFGSRVLYRETTLAKGTSQIALEGFAALPPGVYAWALLLDATRVAEGRIVKQ